MEKIFTDQQMAIMEAKLSAMSPEDRASWFAEIDAGLLRINDILAQYKADRGRFAAEEERRRLAGEFAARRRQLDCACRLPNAILVALPGCNPFLA